MCRNYNRVLDHLGASRSRISSINKHIKGVNCRNAIRRPNIKKAIEHAVRLLNPYSLLYSNLYTRRVVLLLSQYLSPRMDRSDRFLG
jgi:ABC-type transporter Mla subunit MlaD